MIKLNKKRTTITWEKAPDIHKELIQLVELLEFNHIDPPRILSYRSYGSQARARARIWSLPHIWQLALDVKPHYVIEVISEKFDHLSANERKRILIHELMHIPKTFSGALVPHRGRYHAINPRAVELLFRRFLQNINTK